MCMAVTRMCYMVTTNLVTMNLECGKHGGTVMFHNTPKLILTNPNCPQCHGTQSASCPTPTNTKPTSMTPPALRDHLACPSDSQNDLMDPGPNTDCLPRHCHH